ncbi:hypothetical protein [Streptomyces sp. HUAS ZL42]|uniref:hypothetical protein n=1 Tax=Streptomyces sp. HUAS ZL42 TaxID=3231715 RepID=UPI00345E98C2
MQPAPPSSRPATEARPAEDTVSDFLRWAAFSCVLVPVVLLCHGASFAGALSAALGLAAVTVACRFLLRESQRGARVRRGARHTGGNTPVG